MPTRGGIADTLDLKSSDLGRARATRVGWIQHQKLKLNDFKGD